MTIKKITLEVTILLEEKDQDWFSTLSLAQIASEMEEGTIIGNVPSYLSEDVPLDQLEEHLLALGKDGSFFDHLTEESE